MSRDEQNLRAAIATFGGIWLDEDRRPMIEYSEPAPTSKIVEIESMLGAELPLSVRVVLETFDGTFMQPVSPCRPDHVLSASEIWSRVGNATEVVPIIERGLDPGTGMSRLLGVSVHDTWGPLVAGDGFEYPETTSLTLVGWFEQVIAETLAYEPPAPLALTPSPLAPRTAITEADLRTAPVGAAFASVWPEVKRNRMRLQLYVQLEPDVWAHGCSRQGREELSLDERAHEACTEITREIRRDRSQWAMTATQIAARIRPDRQLFSTTVRIEPA
jgi:hypothetical protein